MVKSLEYWAKQEASIHGVLGGYENLHGKDIVESRHFLEQAHGSSRFTIAAEVGAGIGRVTEHLLQHVADRVHVYEPVTNLLQQAKSNLAPLEDRVEFFQQRLQDFQPSQNSYQLIWVQWCTLYLDDDELLQFLNRCAEGLTDNGLVILKENIAHGEGWMDEEDESHTRSFDDTTTIIDASNLSPTKFCWQRGWPTDLCKVGLWALKKGQKNESTAQ